MPHATSEERLRLSYEQFQTLDPTMEGFMSGFITYARHFGNEVSNIVHKTKDVLDSLMHQKKSTLLANRRKLQEATNNMNFAVYSNNYMQVPEGLTSDLPGYSAAIFDMGGALLSMYKVNLDELNTMLGQLISGIPVNPTDTQSTFKRFNEARTKMFADLTPSLAMSDSSHVTIHQVFDNKQDIFTWLMRVGQAPSVPSKESIQQFIQQLETASRYMDILSTDHKLATDTIFAAKVKMLGELAFQIALNASIVSDVSLMNQMVSVSADKLSTKMIKDLT